MDATRRFYEARVLVIPHGPSALAREAEMRELGLDGVMTLHPSPAAGAGGSTGHRLRPLASSGWAAPATVRSLGDAVTGTDIVVLLTADPAEVDAAACHIAAEAARTNGAMIAALVIRPEAGATAAADTAMAALRAAADMVVIVRGPGLAGAFLDVLRGGRRETATAG